MEQFIKKIFSSFLLIAVLILSLPSQSYAQVPDGQGFIDPGLFGADPDGQAGLATFGVDPNFNQAELDKYAAELVTLGAGGCLVSNVITDQIKSTISNFAAGFAEAPAEAIRVPVFDPDSKQLRAKEVSSASTNIRGINVNLLPSWDSLAYCLVNQIIDYIGQATVDWINNGFEGNPVFVDNPGKFFGDIADIEAGIFIEELGLGFLCEPFEAKIKIALAERQTRTYRDQATCSFSEASGNIEQFLSGETFSWEDWISVTQYPQNNVYGSYLIASAELNSRIAGRQTIESIQLDWGNGFLSFKDKETGAIKTPGNVIENRINERLGSGERRIEMADEFDEIINALVNQLVKIAVNQVFDKQ